MQDLRSLYKIQDDILYLLKVPIKGNPKYSMQVAQEIYCSEFVPFPEEVEDSGKAYIRANFNTSTELNIDFAYSTDYIEIIFDDGDYTLSVDHVMNLFNKYGIDFDTYIKQVYNKFVQKFNDSHYKAVLYKTGDYYWDDDRYELCAKMYDFKNHKMIEHEPLTEVDIELLEME